MSKKSDLKRIKRKKALKKAQNFKRNNLPDGYFVDPITAKQAIRIQTNVEKNK